MRRVLLRIRDEEISISRLIAQNKVSIPWMMVVIFWHIFGIYTYNELPSNNTVITKMLFLTISISIIWKNRGVIRPFFLCPFKHVITGNPLSNILWVYPFAVLLVSAVFVILPQTFGWLPKDPQNIVQMSLTMMEYIVEIMILPLTVFTEESLNVLTIVVLAALLSKSIKQGWFFIVILGTSCFFGFLHIFAWGWEAAISRMLIHIPFIFSILYFRTAWISMLAHFYQNAMTYTTVIYPTFSSLFVGIGLLACFLIILYRKILNKFSR